jgi:protein required for attachment to host cells
MTEQGRVWICVADNRGARLLASGDAPPGRRRLEVLDSLDNEREELEHGRPSPRIAKEGHSYASLGHEEDERLIRFAADVVAWLTRHAAAENVEQLAIFAGPQLLGAMRKAYSPELTSRVREHKADLGNLPPAQLAQHAAVLGVLQELELEAAEAEQAEVSA